MQTNLTVLTTSAFATPHDMLGNPYQVVTNITGTRVYTYLPTPSTLISQVSGPASNLLNPPRFYPYALLSSLPGVYTMSTAPFLDAQGWMLSINPPVPVNGGAPGTGQLYNTTSVAFTPFNNAIVLLTEAHYLNAPLLALQQQLYSFQ